MAEVECEPGLASLHYRLAAESSPEGGEGAARAGAGQGQGQRRGEDSRREHGAAAAPSRLAEACNVLNRVWRRRPERTYGLDTDGSGHSAPEPQLPRPATPTFPSHTHATSPNASAASSNATPCCPEDPAPRSTPQWGLLPVGGAAGKGRRGKHGASGGGTGSRHPHLQGRRPGPQ